MKLRPSKTEEEDKKEAKRMIKEELKKLNPDEYNDTTFEDEDDKKTMLDRREAKLQEEPLNVLMQEKIQKLVKRKNKVSLQLNKKWE